jgi:hypothetical protein
MSRVAVGPVVAVTHTGEPSQETRRGIDDGPTPGHGPKPNRTGDQANLYVDANDPYPTHFSVDSTVKLYTGAGVTPGRSSSGSPSTAGAGSRWPTAARTVSGTLMSALDGGLK